MLLYVNLKKDLKITDFSKDRVKYHLCVNNI